MRTHSAERGSRLRAKLRETTQEVILAAAEEAFVAEGLHGVRMESIASRAGVSVGTLYNHFRDREALLGAVVQTRRAFLVKALDEALAAGEGRPFEEQARLFLDAWLARAAEHGRFVLLLVQTDPVPGARNETLLDAVRLRAAELMRRGIAQQVLRPEGADVYAWVFVAMARTAMLRRLRGIADDGVAWILGIFLDGARRR